MQVPRLSGRAIYLDLMKYENSRQAASFLGSLLQDEKSAMHPFIMSLPEDIRIALLDPDHLLRRLLHAHTPSSSYAAANPEHANNTELCLRAGPRSMKKTLAGDEFALLASLVLPAPVSQSQLMQLHHELALTESLAKSQQAIADADSVIVSTVRWLLLPGRDSRSGLLWADTDRKTNGLSHYTLDEDLNHDNSIYAGRIVRLDNLFLVRDVGFAYVTYGKRGYLDSSTGCYAYSFSEDDQSGNIRKRPRIILASRLRSYAHFGFVRGHLLLNRFYIPTS